MEEDTEKKPQVASSSLSLSPTAIAGAVVGLAAALWYWRGSDPLAAVLFFLDEACGGTLPPSSACVAAVGPAVIGLLVLAVGALFFSTLLEQPPEDMRRKIKIEATRRREFCKKWFKNYKIRASWTMMIWVPFDTPCSIRVSMTWWMYPNVVTYPWHETVVVGRWPFLVCKCALPWTKQSSVMCWNMPAETD